MKNKIIQKLIGIFFIIIGIAVPILDNGDITTSMLFVPMGLCLLCTKGNYITVFKETEDGNDGDGIQ